MAQGDNSSIGLLGSLRRFTRNVQVILSLLAVGIGLMAGLAAIGFRFNFIVGVSSSWALVSV